jgi:hypothetical protein
MRLIDADKLILHLNDYALQIAPFRNLESTYKYNAVQECIKAVEEQPIAYNMDKVVEQLGEIKVIGTYPYDVVKEAIEIVKGGEIDGR